MTMTQSLLDFILNLLRDSDAKTAFVADPQKALADAGLGEVCSEDVSDAMSYVAEYHPVTFVGDRDYNLGNTNISQHITSDRPDHGHGPDHNYGPDPHATPVQQLEYITANYSYTDSHDTVIDKSVNQSIWNEGTLDQRFDDHSVTATDHSVAAGGDINAPVANGNDNVVGEGNSVGNTSYRDDHSDDHSVRGSFNGDNIADHGGVAGQGNDGNATDPHNSNVATGGSALENAPRDSHDTTTRDSFNDSHNRDSEHITTIDSGNDNPHYNDNSHHSATADTFHNQSFNDESFNHDSAITHTEQHGLVNAALSPAVALPVHDNELDVLDHSEHHLPT
ncbi:MAG: IniB N-terminal domain-containing protein [Pseudonocardiales bacterium]|nr:IniB N-terminal domain-containing protein [Pseudonocardiales bacterium]MBV9032524.1 IniB N-terminal domain-containing protein [Pseudonocardiales bacterium]MBW0009575.1 IniB N-terminal domain-containing protein [Pseudonocardiales bacterium]